MIRNVNKMKDQSATRILSGDLSRKGAFLNADELQAENADELLVKRAEEWRAKRIEDEKKMDAIMPRSEELKKLIGK